MKKQYLNIFVGLITLFLLSCVNSKKVIMGRDKKQVITAPIVTKNFIKKNGESIANTELYIQRSIQDYYIKFCESKVTRKELEKHLSTLGLIRTATLEVEFKEGNWDICDKNLQQQSRIGEYVILNRIIK